FLQQKVEFFPEFASTVEQLVELLQVAAQTVELFADVAAFGQHGGFLRNTGWVDGGAAQQILEPRFQAPRECRPQLNHQTTHNFSLFRDVRQAAAQIFDQVAAFGAAHFIQLAQRFTQAGFERLAKPFLFFFAFWHGRRKAANYTGKTQQGNDVESGRNCSLQAKFIGGAQVVGNEVAVHLDRSGRARFDAYVHFDMAAMDALADELAQTQFV